ncbi:transposase [Candidatus Vondammii sp. HM_W22]|uniref:transposase n=1 Tax=Candidatus Vondammii sp. HM_W22 TaxID=2687299 RepID=UPI002E7B0AF8|nr:transposase [Candidatus Vondammii sp. HM_W22]
MNAVVLEVSNGPAGGLSSRIKMIKVRSRGFRNKERFANAIYLHLGGLNLYPEGVVGRYRLSRLGEEPEDFTG